MSQFSVYRNNGANKAYYPYIINVQSELLDGLESRVVIPLADIDLVQYELKKLTPIFMIEGRKYFLMTNLITSVPAKILRDDYFVCDALHRRNEILAAMDLLITGI